MIRLLCWSIAVPALVFFALIEIGLEFPIPGWAYASDVALLAVALLVRPRNRPVEEGAARAKRIVFAVACAIVLALHFVPWSPRKPFLQRFDRIEVGMSEAEVRNIMAGYMEGAGIPPLPGTAGVQEVVIGNTGSHYRLRDSIVFRHSDDGRYNADWGIVSLSDGKVVGTEFSPD